MSLLDDVSIVVTPNGYKAGTLYGVLPTATEGSELVVNGDFATDSDWTKGSSWSISGGKANYDAVTTASELKQLMSSIAAGKIIKIQFDILDVQAGKDAFFKLEIDGSPEAVFGYTKFSEGTYTYYHTIANAFDRLAFFPLNTSTGGAFSIDNVSVKEWTASDMDVTRATAATRVDENGLVNYAEVVSNTELVNNGDFATDSVWTKTNATIDTDTNKATITITGGGFSSISQALTYTNGNLYRVNATINGTASKQMRFMDNSSSAGGLTTTNGVITMTGSDQNIEITWTANANSNIITFDRHTGSGDYSFTVSSVSVKEVTRNNVPRIDYTGGGCPKILSEPQRTNLIKYSEDFSQSYWTVYLKSVTGTVNVILKDPNATITQKSLSVTTEWQRFELSEDNGTSSQGLWVDDILQVVFIFGVRN